MRQWYFRLAVTATLVSMGFTGWFGWVIGGGGDQPLGGFLSMIAGFVVSILATGMWILKAKADTHGAAPTVGLTFLSAAIFFSIIDAISNVGAVFAMREADLLRSAHQTVVSRDARGEVVRVETLLSGIKARLAKLDSIETPGVYDQQIVAAKAQLGRDGRNIWQRSEQCQDVTVPESRDHCAKIAAIGQKLSQAREKQRLERERASYSTSLPEIKRNAAKTPEDKAAIMALMERFGQIASLGQDPNSLVKNIVYLVVAFIFGVSLTLATAVAGYGWIWLGEHEEEPNYDPDRKLLPYGNDSRYSTEAGQQRQALGYVPDPDDSLDRLAADIAAAHRKLQGGRRNVTT